MIVGLTITIYIWDRLQYIPWLHPPGYKPKGFFEIQRTLFWDNPKWYFEHKRRCWNGEMTQEDIDYKVWWTLYILTYGCFAHSPHLIFVSHSIKFSPNLENKLFRNQSRSTKDGHCWWNHERRVSQARFETESFGNFVGNNFKLDEQTYWSETSWERSCCRSETSNNGQSQGKAKTVPRGAFWWKFHTIWVNCALIKITI